MDHPEKEQAPDTLSCQGRTVTTQHLASAAASSRTDVPPASRGCNRISGYAVDSDSAADISDASLPPTSCEDLRHEPDDAPALLCGVAKELARAHQVSLDMQVLFSRALSGMDARPDMIHEAQGLDRLSQTLENLARLLQLMSWAYPRQPSERQIEECLTLQDLQSRLCGDQGEPSRVSLAAVEREASDGRAVADPAPEAERCMAESGEISWL